jgi:translation initiation factor IF-1
MKNGWFELDATVIDVINYKASRVRLANGHQLVAFFACPGDVRPLRPGDRVRVEMSPCDMSKGRICMKIDELEQP